MRRERRKAITLLGIGAAPFGLALARNALGSAGQVPVPCPFRYLTGLPCPFCGGTRAFSFLMSGDGSFVNYGAAWVALAALLVLLGTVGLLASLRGRTLLSSASAWITGRWRYSFVAIAALTVMVAWAWALANRSTIAPESRAQIPISRASS